MSLLRVSTPVLHAEATGRIKVGVSKRKYCSLNHNNLPLSVHDGRAYYSSTLSATVQTLLNTHTRTQHSIHIYIYLLYYHPPHTNFFTCCIGQQIYPVPPCRLYVNHYMQRSVQITSHSGEMHNKTRIGKNTYYIHYVHYVPTTFLLNNSSILFGLLHFSADNVVEESNIQTPNESKHS